MSIGLLGLLLFVGSFSTAKAQCTVSLETTVSGCYDVNGASKATVSVEVNWTDAPANAAITVTGPAGSNPATRTITPGTISVTYNSLTGSQTIVSPQVVAFEIPANGATGLTVRGQFSSSCSATSSPFNAPASCLPTTCSGNQVGGVVFNDYNGNGIKEAGETVGQSGVTVKAFNTSGVQVGRATTDAFGKYSMAIAAYPVRLEFSTLPTILGSGTPQGTNGQTTVQFVTAASCDVDLGVLNPTDFCQRVPKITVPCFVSGDPLPVGSASGLMDALVSFNYGESGLKDPTKITVLASAKTIGAVWGSAYNKYTDKLYTSATVKRHSGLGPLGLGGIYVTDMASGVTTSFVNVSLLGINVGSLASNSARGLSTDPSQSSTDYQAFTAIGKVGIGDLDIAEDGSKLWFVNLFDKKLYSIDISNGTPGAITSVSIPDPGCAGGSARPFALKVYQGKVYVGQVCDALSSQDKSNLRASVYEYNGTAFTEIFDFPLTYPKGYPFSNMVNTTGWFPWTDDATDYEIAESTSNFVMYPQPILSDLEFDIDGSMILGFADRTGLQVGAKNILPDVADPAKLYVGIAGGDILRAYKSGTSFVLENNAGAGPTTGNRADNQQGPGFGEFYNDNFLVGSYIDHAEDVYGGLALKPGSGEVIVSVMDPIDVPSGERNTVNYKNAGGIRHMNNTTGEVTNAFQVYQANDVGTYGKAVGLGDIEVTCSLPTYVELGNRVWIDLNKDGVQGPDELPLAGVIIQLLDNTGALVATKTTDAKGQYYFGITDGLRANTTYTLVIGATQYNGTILTLNGINYESTLPNSTTGSGNDINDSDASVVAGQYVISVNMLNSATVNHSLDAGFIIGCPSPNCYPTTVLKN